MRSRMMALSLGISSVCWFPYLPERFWLYSCLLILPLVSFMPSRWFQACIWLLAGLFWGVEFGYRVLESELPVELEGGVFEVEGEVVGLPGSYERHQRFRLKLNHVTCISLKDCEVSIDQLQLNWYQTDLPVIPGQRWRLRVKLKRPHGMANPGGFDYRTWMVQQGINAVGYVREDEGNQRLGHNNWSVAYWRWRLCRQLDPILGELRFGAILQALLTGDRQGISQQQWQLFSHTNTTHLMVISGLHIGLVAGLGFCLGRMLALLTLGRLAPERAGAILGLSAAIFYSCAAGFSLPTQRALVMVSVLMSAMFLRRQLPAGYGLLLALSICLLMDPLAPASLSFWLSFTAVSVIVYGLCGRVLRPNWWQGIRVQWLAFIGLMPALALFFGQLSVLSPLANVVLVPVFSLFIVPINFLSMLLVVIAPQWAWALFSLLNRALEWVFDYLIWLQQIPLPSLLKVPAPDAVDLLLACAGVAIALLPRAVPLRFCGLLLLAPLLLTHPDAIKNGDLKIAVLDVGQGLSVVLQTATHVLVYDIGPSYSDRFSTGTSVVVPYLNKQGIERVDALVLSHGDNDHSGSWRQFLEQVDVKNLFYGEAFIPLPRRLDGYPCRLGESWEWDDVTFSFYYPEGNEGGSLSANNMSCVLKISTLEASVLLTGDIERSVEAKLLSSLGEQLSVDILLAPHHGSKTSSSWPFVRWVNPGHVVFTVGYLNRFGHPHADVVKRYKLQGSEIYNTAHDGAITFFIKQGEISSVQRYRSQLKRYWL